MKELQGVQDQPQSIWSRLIAFLGRIAMAVGIPAAAFYVLYRGFLFLRDSQAPQGVVATCAPIEALSLKDLVAGAPEPAALLVLDHLEDPHNVGAIARSAWAAGMHGLVVARARAAPLSAAAFKAAAGALEHLAIAEVGSTADAVKRLSDAGVWTVGLSASAGSDLFGLELLAQPVAVVVGAEGTGLAHLVEERCDVLASIPMANPLESLNASVAAALASFEVLRARR